MSTAGGAGGAGGASVVPVRVRAHAKLTLSLRILGRRRDGYHDLEALTCSLERPADVVEVEARPDTPGAVSLEVTPGAPRPDAPLGDAPPDDVPGGTDNIATRAAEALLAHLHPDGDGPGLAVRLEKAIPAGAGLGGGSADAAAVLRAGAELLGGRRDTRGLDELARALGSDVPFCLRGGLAWMRGRGERIEPLALPAGWQVVVIVPPRRVGTADVYRAWDELGGPRSEREIEAPEALRPLAPLLANDLEPAALAVEPALADLRARLEAEAGRPALLAGSGSGFFVPVDEHATTPAADLAAHLRAELPELVGSRALVAHGPPAPAGQTAVPTASA